MKQLFHGAYAGTRVLVTGHTGFKGSWLCLWLHAMGADIHALALPPAAEPCHWSLLGLADVRERHVDVRDASALRAALADARPEIVFHLAAQSLVRPGYLQPSDTFATNVAGVVNLFEAVRACASVRAVVNVTTDKVYREPPGESGYAEDDALGGHDPYSTSKACAELVTDCYRKSYFTGAGHPGPRLASARAGNVIGGGDWAEDRLVPDMVRAAAAGTPLRLRHPDAVRPWQHVLDCLSGYLRLGQGLLAGAALEGAWNFGPEPASALPVREVVAHVQAVWPRLGVESAPGPHPREAGVLTLDCRKATALLDWRPVWDAQRAIQRTMDWYRAFDERGDVRSSTDLRAYVDAARDAGLAWAKLA
ncbi:MAG: CDP-glucose 4,6-dehydratase [Lysobacteraceae bacterium]|nr:MAG: CDP-glucose 4,6-dehydratase [Xanthomonadaceae bacterium]